VIKTAVFAIGAYLEIHLSTGVETAPGWVEIEDLGKNLAVLILCGRY